MFTIDPIDEIHMSDDELAQALGRPAKTKASVLVDDLLDHDARIAVGVARLQ